MLASSVLVLTVLTVTGIFVQRSNRAEKEDYVVDFEAIEKGSGTTAENLMSGEELDTLFAEVGTDDLDYDPSFQEANSQKVENTDETSVLLSKSDKSAGISGKPEAAIDEEAETDDKEQEKEDDKKENDKKENDKKENSKKEVSDKSKEKSDEEEEGMFDESVDTASAPGEAEAAEAISTTVQPSLDFNEEDGLVWPIVGDVLINYSMDKSVYFETMQEYRHNPAIMIAAQKGAGITAAADGRVTSVGQDRITGNTVVMDLGNGYELTYGQLENITVSEGSYVSVGDPIGTVAAPTKYFSMEGTNVYFKLTKDGQPVNPMSKLH